MAQSGRLMLNIPGFIAIRKSAAATALLRAEAEKVRARCGEGYAIKESPSRNRARFTVFPETEAAIHDNAAHNTLLKALK